MTIHVQNRNSVLTTLREELVGPSPHGTKLDCKDAIQFETAAESYGPWVQAGTGQEIINRDRPTKRYGIGILYPLTMPPQELTDADEVDDATEQLEESVLSDSAFEDLSNVGRSEVDEAGESDDFDLLGANTYRPSSFGISFLCEFVETSELVVELSGGRYAPTTIRVGSDLDTEPREWTWWLRSDVRVVETFRAADLNTAGVVLGKRLEDTSGELNLNVQVLSRSHEKGQLLTVYVVNRSEAPHAPDEHCLFQTHFRVSVKSPDGTVLPAILPYPAPPHQSLDAEEQSFELLYQNAPTYAVGHGCAADWATEPSGVVSVSAECLPERELPSFTPDIKRQDGSRLQVPLAPLAGLVDGNDGYADLAEVVEQYRKWIEDKRLEVESLAIELHPTALRHLDECEACANRMQRGLDFLRSDSMSQRAFQLANRAMLFQQIRTSNRELRSAHVDARNKQIVFDTAFEPLRLDNSSGSWRAFQIAFLLMSIESTVNGNSPDRDIVELIWFPTGGGKTEAYSGLAAFAMFLRRLRDPNDCGVHVLMRYTLRLLTAQQFQRASALICAMEKIRIDEELGGSKFSIGIWVGSDNTPNWNRDALTALRKLEREGSSTQNRFLVTRCPWCRAQIGPIDYKPKRPRNSPAAFGYKQEDNTVRICCTDPNCDFFSGLPIRVVDEDIYNSQPTLLIGTIDKFATLAWREEARSIFGLDSSGERVRSPPELIIQDELHLISGPLGSLSGLYESVVEDLCTDRRSTAPVLPKIVSSTATIRRFQEQILNLYGRNHVSLFPPPGLDAGDSFFAEYARTTSGDLMPGRKYVGVHGAGLGSLQTAQVRSFSALLQSSMAFDNAGRDPWWTMLVFFNSLRELGTSLSLFQSDIPDYFKAIKNRYGLDWSDLRKFYRIRELTGRLRDDEIPLAIADLENKTTGRSTPVDVCLASNIIEVGIDIDRLSLMTVVGQPKTTSQYIQVTGRVGRKWSERPGLVVTIYSPSKPRDRSHFEKFRSYHDRLYAHVEPTSVTPFSAPALERALHAIQIAFVKQNGNSEAIAAPTPFPQDLLLRLRTIVLDRVAKIDPAELGRVQEVFDRRMTEWKSGQRPRWTSNELKESPEDAPLMHRHGEYVPSQWNRLSWPTPTSLRNVDAECQVEISQLYIADEIEDNA